MKSAMERKVMYGEDNMRRRCLVPSAQEMGARNAGFSSPVYGSFEGLGSWPTYFLLCPLQPRRWREILCSHLPGLRYCGTRSPAFEVQMNMQREGIPEGLPSPVHCWVVHQVQCTSWALNIARCMLLCHVCLLSPCVASHFLLPLSSIMTPAHQLDLRRTRQACKRSWMKLTLHRVCRRSARRARTGSRGTTLPLERSVTGGAYLLRRRLVITRYARWQSVSRA